MITVKQHLTWLQLVVNSANQDHKQFSQSSQSVSHQCTFDCWRINTTTTFNSIPWRQVIVHVQRTRVALLAPLLVFLFNIRSSCPPHCARTIRLIVQQEHADCHRSRSELVIQIKPVFIITNSRIVSVCDFAVFACVLIHLFSTHQSKELSMLFTPL